MGNNPLYGKLTTTIDEEAEDDSDLHYLEDEEETERLEKIKGANNGDETA